MSRYGVGSRVGSRRRVSGRDAGPLKYNVRQHPLHTYVAYDARSIGTYIYLPTISRYCVCNEVPGAAAATGIARAETTWWWCIIAIMRATNAAPTRRGAHYSASPPGSVRGAGAAAYTLYI